MIEKQNVNLSSSKKPMYINTVPVLLGYMLSVEVTLSFYPCILSLCVLLFIVIIKSRVVGETGMGREEEATQGEEMQTK